MDSSAATTAGAAAQQDRHNKPPGENKHTKFIRLLTVIAYVCSVSMAAVMLSLYYVFLWDPGHKDGINSAAFQQPGDSLEPTTTYNNDSSNSTASSSPLLRHLIGNYTTAVGTFFPISFRSFTSGFFFLWL